MTEVLIAAGVIAYASGLVRMHLDRFRLWWSYLAVLVGVVLQFPLHGVVGLEVRGPVVLSGIAAAFLGLAAEACVNHYTSSPVMLRRR